MIVVLNGVPTTVPDESSVAEAVRLLNLRPNGVAVSVDREVVPRSQWDTVVLNEGASIEVLSAAAGG
jgi:sulfur carrier protein